MDYVEIIKLVISSYRDKVQEELLEKLRTASISLLEADAEARRNKAREDILAMAKLKNALALFKFTYGNISKQCGKIDAIDEIIRDVEKNIKLISYKKNKKHF